MYTTLKFVHVMASIVWIGSGVAVLTVTAGMVRARDYAGVAALGRQSEKLGTRLFAPSAMITLVAGVAMVIVGDLSFANTWIVIGLVGVAASFVLGAVLGERAQAQLREALASQGIGVASTTGDGPAAGGTSAAGGTPDDVVTQPTIDHAAVDVARRRLTTVSTIDLMVLTVVVWAMVAKPGL
jgi:uncharacterized membrane protein